ncbi:serine kinase [Aurantiacibacter poecillastricola]|uniref:serine kinase n=1 Tax=Aurantiacibacter poecillastricola TaxID=3064385 RepID=UPI00273E20F7|nr:serine kinase [Aurantiacibacter sp. 219JJ12-13]MDP5263227.1 serine kinase [Aurantiacibacter sp. 219JJ12-13]
MIIGSEAIDMTARRERAEDHPWHIYSAFGLGIASQVPLPELTSGSASAPCDLSIELMEGEWDPAEDNRFTFTEREQFLRWWEVGEFTVHDGCRIEVLPAPGVGPDLMGFALLGPVMGLVLQSRGNLVLHGSALSVAGKAVAFLGDKGAGKSTTAAALVSAGHHLLTDDLIAIRTDPATQESTIAPAFGQVKLAADAAGAIALVRAQRRPQVKAVIDKDRFMLAEGFASAPMPPSRFYLLARGDRLEQVPLNGTERFKALLRFSYVCRFGPQAMWRKAASQHMLLAGLVAQQTPISILRVPRDLDRISALVDLVEADAAQSGS